jgi:hypothetical protein
MDASFRYYSSKEYHVQGDMSLVDQSGRARTCELVVADNGHVIQACVRARTYAYMYGAPIHEYDENR